jgi:hypothetical protein
MTRTLEATLNADGTLDPETPLPCGRARRVVILILDEAPRQAKNGSPCAGDEPDADDAAIGRAQAGAG